VAGSGFISSNDPAPEPPRTEDDKWWLRLGNVELEVSKWTDTYISATLGEDLELAELASQTDAEIIVYNTRGRASAAKVVPVLLKPQV
jgi:hypothetical protein